MRVNLTLDDAHADLLVRLAEAAHVQPGTFARSLLLNALDRSGTTLELDPQADIAQLLDSIPGAHEAIARGKADIAAGRGIPLDQLR